MYKVKIRERFSFWLVVVLLSGLAIFGLHWLAPVSYAGSDARFSLYLSQAMLDTGTPRLDSLAEHLPSNPESDYRLEQIGNHVYYAFPWGTSFFSLPFVYLANLLDKYPITPPAEDALQAIIAASVSMGIFFVLVGMARCYLSRWQSLLIALVMMLGSPLTSTLGTSLWGQNFTLLFTTFSLFLMVRRSVGKEDRGFSALLGLCLFGAFVSRPTTAVFILLAFLYLLFTQSRRVFVTTAVAAFIPLALFSLYTYQEMGMWLAPYYQPNRLNGTGSPWWLVLYGLLFSPGRGLFIFTPICFFAIVVTVRYIKILYRQPLFWLATTWITFHVVAIMRFSHWWGGASFGPRLLTDTMPAFYLLLVLSWKQVETSRYSRIWQGSFALIVIISLFINSYVPLFNPFARTWNGPGISPLMDNAPSYLFDWRFPQFLASSQSLCARNQDFFEQTQAQNLVMLSPYKPNSLITAAMSNKVNVVKWPLPGVSRGAIDNQPATDTGYSNQVFLPLIQREFPFESWWTGWYMITPDQTAVKAFCPTTIIEIGEISPIQVDGYNLGVIGRSERPLPITVSINNTPIAEFDMSTEFTQYNFPIDARLLNTTSSNQIRFEGAIEDNLILQSLQIVAQPQATD